MLLDLLRRYPDLIAEIEVERFRVVGESYAINATVHLKDGSRVFMKEYLFLDGTRKYAYHWQDREGRLLMRWDNAPHWKSIKSFPHHQHVRDPKRVEASRVRTIEDAFEYIKNHLEKSENG